MWNRLRGRLFSAVGVVVLVVWFVGSIAIATGPLGLEADRSNRGIVTLIFLGPAAGVVVVHELVHRVRFGPTKPGRHLRGPLDLDVLSDLDKGLKRGDDENPAD